MKTGIIVLGLDSRSPGTRRTAEGCAEYLRSKGRKNVEVAFLRGEPYAEDVMRAMHSDGVDTFSILPLSVSEGKNTVWLMPASVLLPDNFGSWTMIDGKDVATRFATALGPDQRMLDALVEELGPPSDGKGALLVSRGSPHSTTKKTAMFYVEGLREAGWKAEWCADKHGIGLEDAVESLKAQGVGKLKVVPLYVAFDGPSSERVRDALKTTGMKADCLRPVSELPVFKEILDSKVPEGWRRSGNQVQDIIDNYSLHSLPRLEALRDPEVGDGVVVRAEHLYLSAGRAEARGLL